MRHAIDRARERYGLQLEPTDILQMRRKVIEGKDCLLLRRMPPTTPEQSVRLHYIICHKETTMVVVVDSKTKHIVTVLPPSNINHKSMIEGKRKEGKHRHARKRRKKRAR